MLVQWAIPCRYVEVQPGGGATIVGAGSDVVVLPQTPAPAQLLFAVRYAGTPEELDGETEHQLVCRIFNPEGTQVGEQHGIMKAASAQIVDGYVAELIVPSAVVIEVLQHGTHRVQFGIDDDVADVPVHFVRPEDVPGARQSG